ncbi:UDP-4-amino-4,6-dideoxy-N-acetyl-beta-L-altrosamine transaminase [bacterium]|nr:UDP-4-amino-4,6-dideoxy-N-acetyl-beta-L-altrosamine transaminase [Akkermansiaceae bacterium]MDA8980726.1 UDP-4-amino-4,6-dideoxy-N-acetyl-beta-L-altrosamine transaminase [bacterium]MDB4455673.1 UDP-4-amino-4,6-dideoxy-N-acetyl-beta-L-altrosamine transaminase [bacterium]MDB4508617.1 UDP-4-amino-4,6-dideoxy-N-acetyl-beta-L-altrosamine transaminase [Akkermansiaceae bacterium]MDB4577853.1 UDP-4-amino-4,6-dideoxy-N-acetyl-beta-L-altrosamine transaminase [Akkermansiaceae bacterium]
MKFTPYGRQAIDEDDISSVVAALRSDYLTCGPEVEAFENEFAQFVGAKYAVAVSNATDALHLAMRVAKISEGDRVVTSPNTFLSSANCAAFVGATPDFCDINPDTLNLDAKALAENWKDDTKAVIAVAYAGQAAEMPAIAGVARSHGAIVIEDACHGTGGGFSYEGKDWKLGGHPWADMTTFSFHPVKTMTTGEGGILVTDHLEYAQQARLLRSHGMVRTSEDFIGFGTDREAYVEQGPWIYEMQELGYNFRITDLQCALGRSQLKKLPKFIERRLQIVARYNEAFADLAWLQVPKLGSWLLDQNESGKSLSWHLYTVQIEFSKLQKTRTEVMTELREKGVGSQVLYIPVHLQPYYRKTYGYEYGKCPIAEDCYERVLSLPLFPSMTEEEISKVIEAVRNL